MLSYLTKIQARATARTAWIEAGADPEMAEDLFRQSYRKASHETILELVTFALEMFQHWIDTGTTEPSVVATADEPMGFDE